MEREKTCVLVADSFRARIFDAKLDKGQHHLRGLEERMDFVNPRAQEGFFQSTNSPVRRPSSGGPNGYDHRTQEDDHSDKMFAKQVSQELGEYARTHKADHLILVAPPTFLGALREHEDKLQKIVPNISEVPKELSGLSAAEICNYLEKRAFALH